MRCSPVRPSRRPDDARTRRSCSPWATTSTSPSGAPRTVPTSTRKYGAASATADRVMREHLTGLHTAAVSAFEREATAAGGAPPDVARVRNAVWVQTHDRPFTYRTPDQKPALFYMPDLPAVPVVPRGRLPWAAALEARTSEVRDEYLAAVEAGAAAFAVRGRGHPRADLAAAARQARLVLAASLQGRTGDAVRTGVPEDAGGARGRRRRAPRGPADGAPLLAPAARRAHPAALRRPKTSGSRSTSR